MASELAQPAPLPATAPITAAIPRQRTRQGCSTCRRRRRKCDELKPQCLNCVEKNLDCSYGLQLIFRDVNLLGLRPSEERELEERGQNSYSDIRFVDASEDDLEDVDRTLKDVVALEDNVPERPRQNDPEVEQLSSKVNDAEVRTEDYPSYKDMGPPGDSEHYESASGIINQDGTRVDDWHTTQHYHRPRSMNSNSLHDNSPAGHQTQLVYHDNGLSTLNDTEGVEESPIANPLKNALLKYFIEKVAPWLDLNSSTKSLGTQLVIMSNNFPQLRSSMLEMAASQEGSRYVPSVVEKATKSALRDLVIRHQGSQGGQDSESANASQILGQVSRLVEADLGDWNQISCDFPPCNCGAYYESWLLSSMASVSWATLRFDIAGTIISGIPMNGHAEQNHELSQLETMNDTQATLAMCARAARLAFPDGTPSVSGKEMWLKLHTSTEDLRRQSEAESQPILVIDGVKAANATDIFTEFPMIVLTNRASFYTSFVHHFTCLLLIQSRHLSLRQTKSTVLKTIPWHAVQLCGISTSNRPAWSWDPVIVAALLHAGKALSYNKQQDELLNHLEHLMHLTGWRMGNEIQKLTNIWKGGY